MSAQLPSSQNLTTNDQLPAQTDSTTNANSESTQHSSGTRKLKRLTKTSGDSLIAKKAARRTSRRSTGRIQVKQPQDLIGVSLATDRYQVKSQLGKGSMAYVFLAEDRRLETDVVIKVPKPELFTTHDFRERFKRESQLLVRFSHPHVVGVLDVGEYDGLPYVVMPLLSGGSLLDRLKKYRNNKEQVAPESLKNWVPDVAKALDFCCRRGMVHRDVKPANILFDDDNNAFVGDFGLSKVMYGEHTELNSSETMAGVVLGTPNYVSPEVIHGKPYDGRADQYSLGITVYQILFGRAPMQGASPTVTMINQTQRRLKLLSEIRSDVSRELALAIQKSISKKPADRFACCEDFADAVLEGLRSPATNTNPEAPRHSSRERSEPSPINNAPRSTVPDVASIESSGDNLDWLNVSVQETSTTTFSVQKPKSKRKGGGKEPPATLSPDAMLESPSQHAKANTDARSGNLPGASGNVVTRLRLTLSSWYRRSTHGTAIGIAAGTLVALCLFATVIWMFGSTTDVLSPVSGISPSDDATTPTTAESLALTSNAEVPTPTSSSFSDTDTMLQQMKNDKQRKIWEWKTSPSNSANKPQK